MQSSLEPVVLERNKFAKINLYRFGIKKDRPQN